MQQPFGLFVLLGLLLLAVASLVGMVAGPTVATGGLACGLALAGGLSLVSAALVQRRSQEDEATIRTLERRVFDLESELEARADDRSDDEP